MAWNCGTKEEHKTGIYWSVYSNFLVEVMEMVQHSGDSDVAFLHSS